jgi:hypothetical protein
LYFNLGGVLVAFILVLRVVAGVLPNRHGRGEKDAGAAYYLQKILLGLFGRPLIGASYVPGSHRKP